MYKVASDKSVRAAHRGRSSDWENGELKLTDEEKRASLVSHLQYLEKELSQTTNRQARKELGLRKFETQNAITAIRPKKKCPDVQQCFIDAAREMLSRAKFNQLMDRAVVLKKEGEIND